MSNILPVHKPKLSHCSRLSICNKEKVNVTSKYSNKIKFGTRLEKCFVGV